MYLLINELSAIGQASTVYDIPDLVRQAFDVISALASVGDTNLIRTHSSLFQCRLSPDCTFHQWAMKRSVEDRDTRLFFIKVVTKGPFINRILDERFEYHECHLNGRDVSHSSVAGAALFEGVLVSFQNAPEFSPVNIQVMLRTGESVLSAVDIRNLTHGDQIRGMRRNYVPSPKHALLGGWGTKMDLDDQVAQQVLDDGIQHGKQVYGCHNEKFYVFQPDNAGGYHGYPVSDIDVDTRVLRQLRNRD